jgi:hypothetical protein
MIRKMTTSEVARLKKVTRAAVILAIQRGALRATMRTAGGVRWYEISEKDATAWKPQYHRKPGKKGAK